MKYLLIDFGASSIKTILYNFQTDSFQNESSFPSPFLTKTVLEKSHLEELMRHILASYPEATKVFSCAILGGYHSGKNYYSWKSSDRPEKPGKPKCLLGGLFKGDSLHSSHAKSLGLEASDEIKIIGTFQNREFYSSLGDTECALNSVPATDKDMILNLGTGSQVVFQGKRQSFIPSGRMLLMFNTFFEALGKNFFEDLKFLNLHDLLSSTLKMDLNVFEQSYLFKEGGTITGILESNFTYKNFISSILKNYCDQYASFIKEGKPDSVFVIGGIPKKLPIITEYLNHLFQETKIVGTKSNYSETHLGMANFIRKEHESMPKVLCSEKKSSLLSS